MSSWFSTYCPATRRPAGHSFSYSVSPTPHCYWTSCWVQLIASLQSPTLYNHVTIKLIVSGQLTGLLLLTIIFKTSFFVNGTFKTISQQPHPHGKTIVFTLMSLVLLCFVTQIAIFLKTKTYFLQQREGRCQAVHHTRADLSFYSSRLNPLNNNEVSSMISPEYLCTSAVRR